MESIVPEQTISDLESKYLSPDVLVSVIDVQKIHPKRVITGKEHTRIKKYLALPLSTKLPILIYHIDAVILDFHVREI